MDLFLDEKLTGDMVFNNGPTLVKAEFPEVVIQRVYIKLKTFRGEWLFNDTYGVDYLGEILGKKVPKEYVDSIIQEAILEEDGVSEIVEWSSSFSGFTRQYSCSFKIRDIYSETVSSLLTVNLF
jgi:hypothetical protein